MVSICHYESPLGGVLLAADEIGLTGLWFDGQKYFARGLPADRVERETPALLEAKRWLDIYFSGKEPDFTPPLHPIGSAFRQSVWEILLQIPTEKPQPTAKLRGSFPKRWGFPGCPRRRSAARWGTTKFPSSFPAIGLSARTAV